MLPISATVIAFFKFLPTIMVYMIMRTILGLPFGWEMLWSIPIIIITLIFSLGVAILISTINVYFRDIASFLPYLTRTFLYLSPILYEASALKPELRVFEYFNPLFPILESWSLSIVHAEAPNLSSMLTALAWAVGVLLLGTYFFLSREREFAVRL
jgi:ABC-type polysaccharide/polyol phosphate export permease